MALIQCVNRACPYANKLTKDGMCRIEVELVEETDPIRTPDGGYVATMEYRIIGANDDEQARKGDCLCEHLDQLGEGISAEVLMHDEEHTEVEHYIKITDDDCTVIVFATVIDNEFVTSNYCIASETTCKALSVGSSYKEALKACTFDNKSEKKGFVALGKKLAEFKKQFENEAEFCSYIIENNGAHLSLSNLRKALTSRRLR